MNPVTRIGSAVEPIRPIRHLSVMQLLGIDRVSNASEELDEVATG
jgi:hypothetical protein